MKVARKLGWFAGIVAAMAVIAGVGFWARPLVYFNEFGYLRMRMEGAESLWVVIHGARVHYYVEGPASGPLVVLVHGLGGRSEDWRELAPYLAKVGYRVYMPDLPGYGRSDKPADFSYSVPDEADVVVSLMDALGLKRVDLGGWSMGGWIAQRVASGHAERVRRLMLFDSAGLLLKPDWDTRLFTPNTAGELDQLDALLMPHPPTIPAFIAQDILRSSRRSAWVVKRALASMLTGRDTTDKLLPELKMPVLIVWGMEDRITPLSEGEAMHRLVPQSELEVIAGCGHLAAGQCARKVGPKVVDFLGR